MPFDRSIFENVPSTVAQPKSGTCLQVSGGNHWGSCGEREKLMSWDCVVRVGLLNAWGNGSTPNLNYTCREICVISLATFTVPVCRWIASEDNPRRAISFKALPAKHTLRC